MRSGNLLCSSYRRARTFLGKEGFCSHLEKSQFFFEVVSQISESCSVLLLEEREEISGAKSLFCTSVLKRKKSRLDFVIYDHPFSVFQRGSGRLLVVLLVEGKQKERRPHLHTDFLMEATAMRKVVPRDPLVFSFFQSTTARRQKNESNIFF